VYTSKLLGFDAETVINKITKAWIVAPGSCEDLEMQSELGNQDAYTFLPDLNDSYVDDKTVDSILM